MLLLMALMHYRGGGEEENGIWGRRLQGDLQKHYALVAVSVMKGHMKWCIF